MEHEEIINIAYIMQNAYKEKRTGHEAVQSVEKQTNLDKDTLYAMWHAIDAYVDINQD